MTIGPKINGPKSLKEPTSISWIQVGRLIDGVSPNPILDAHLVFAPDRILYVGSESPNPNMVDGRTTPDQTLPRQTVLPGLIEAHAHLFLEGGEFDFEKRKSHLKKPATLLLAQSIMRLERLLKLGIIAYRDAGDKDGVGLSLSRLYRSPSHPDMPYVDSPGAAIHHEGRYGSFMADPLEAHPNLETVVANRVQSGANRIKLIPTGIINFKKGAVTAKPQMTLEELRDLVLAAKRHGRQTFAHASGDEGIELAIEARVDSVEHGFFIRDDQLSKLRDYDIAWVPTFTPVQIQVDEAKRMGWDENVVSNLKRILENHSKSLAKAKDIGVRIIAGSDAGSYGVAHGTGFLYELELMEKSGMSPLEIINSATGASASRLGFSEDFGIIRANSKPRFILTEHDISKSVSNLRLPKMTYYDGKFFEDDGKLTIDGL